MSGEKVTGDGNAHPLTVTGGLAPLCSSQQNPVGPHTLLGGMWNPCDSCDLVTFPRHGELLTMLPAT